VRGAIRSAGVWLLVASLSLPTWAQQPGPGLPHQTSHTRAPSKVLPFVASPHAKDFADEEDRIWDESKDAEKTIRRRGALLAHKETVQLLQDLTLHLFPEFHGSMRSHLINDPTLNAFAFPNGGLYFNLGLVARMESVSQLACVVGHEGAHFVNRHSYQSRQSAKTASAFGVASAMFGLVGALGALAAVSSIFGYSRELESEADRVGHARLLKVGMDSVDCVRVFELMAEEAKAIDTKSPVLFASHPKLTERIENFKVLAIKAPAAQAELLDPWEKRFQLAIRPLRQAWLDSALAMGQHGVLVHYLTKPGTEALMPNGYRYYLAEAHRLRAKDGDFQKASEIHRANLESQKDYLPSHLGLGMALLALGDKPGAKESLSTYLRLSPQSQSAAFARQTLLDLEK
jgi:beta-barrel assembly-enhancing protease